jgi:Cu+-exporting ATPase
LKTGVNYTIRSSGNEGKRKSPDEKGNEVFFCPMQCEQTKTDQQAVDSPVCGMALIEETKVQQGGQYTCSMHPEIRRYQSGSCPECGMDLVAMETSESEEVKTYTQLKKKLKIAILFALPVFVISMSDMIPNNPLVKVLTQQK